MKFFMPRHCARFGRREARETPGAAEADGVEAGSMCSLRRAQSLLLPLTVMVVPCRWRGGSAAPDGATACHRCRCKVFLEGAVAELGCDAR